MFTRFNGNVEPFAKDATGTERTVFGDTAQSDDINDNLNTDFLRGWGIVGVNDNPTKQDFNALAYTISNLVAYLYQQGVAEWNTDQEYLTNSYCTGSDGKLYRAKTGTTVSPNQGNNPTTDSTNWEDIEGKFVDLLNAQTIAGIKTFSSFPITPSTAPSSDYQVANKKYVDDNIVTGDFLDSNNLFQIQHQKPSGSNGGNIVTGENTLTLNTVVKNEITGASLSSNQIILPVGKYYVSAKAKVYMNGGVSGFSLHLDNITDTLQIIRGLSTYLLENDVSSYAWDSTLDINGYFELSSTKTLELKCYVENDGIQTYNGNKSNNGDVEIYNDILIWKVG